jgi:hypothetical protein
MAKDALINTGSSVSRRVIWGNLLCYSYSMVKYREALYKVSLLTFRRRSFLLNFSTPYI